MWREQFPIQKLLQKQILLNRRRVETEQNRTTNEHVINDVPELQLAYPTVQIRTRSITNQTQEIIDTSLITTVQQYNRTMQWTMWIQPTIHFGLYERELEYL